MNTASVPEAGESAGAWRRVAELIREAEDLGRGHIQTQDMLDYARGGLDWKLMRSLYGEHLDQCEGCRRGFHYYEARRTEDPFAGRTVSRETREYPLLPLELGNEVREERYERVKSAKQHLMDFIDAGVGDLVIVAGEANPAVYDHDLLVCLERRAARAQRWLGAGRHITVVCGPVIALDKKIPTEADAVFPILAQRGLINLYYSDTRQPQHFRVSDGEFVHVEDYHGAGEDKSRVGHWVESQALASLLKRRVAALSRAGAIWPGGKFVFRPMTVVKKARASLGPQVYDSKTGAELDTLLPHADVA